MKRYKKRKEFSLWVWIALFLLFVAVMIGVCYLISWHYHFQYMHVLENVGILLLAAGGLSFFGDISIRSNVKDNQTKLNSEWSRGLSEDLKLAAGSRVFSIILGIAGLILLVIPILYLSYYEGSQGNPDFAW